MTPEIITRQALAADADSLFEIHQDAIHTLSADHYGPERMRIWFAGRTSSIYARAIEEQRVWVAEAKGLTQGFVGVIPGEILWLYVRAVSNGLGIGSRLLRLGIEKAQAGSGGPVEVVALVNAESFYLQRGFAKVADDSFERGDPPLRFPVVKLVLAEG
jgi:GNAT superfamily N-acetyltransferase